MVTMVRLDSFGPLAGAVGREVSVNVCRAVAVANGGAVSALIGAGVVMPDESGVVTVDAESDGAVAVLVAVVAVVAVAAVAAAVATVPALDVPVAATPLLSLLHAAASTASTLTIATTPTNFLRISVLTRIVLLVIALPTAV